MEINDDSTLLASDPQDLASYFMFFIVMQWLLFVLNSDIACYSKIMLDYTMVDDVKSYELPL